jgi:hypothetical protein
MDKSKIIQTLYDMQEIAKRLEEICKAQDIPWGKGCSLSVGNLDLNNPEKTKIRLSWTVYGWGNSPPEDESVLIPLSLLWEPDAIQRLKNEREEKLRLKNKQKLLKRIAKAKENIAIAELANKELEDAIRELNED